MLRTCSASVIGLIWLLVPLLWLLALMVYRVSLELMVVAVKISEDLRVIRVNGTMR